MYNRANKGNTTTAVLALILLLGSLFLSYTYGKSNVQKKWDAATAVQKSEYDSLQGRYDQAAKQHRLEITELKIELTNKKAEYEKSINSNRVVYDKRLLDSKKREAIYKSQSQGGAIECGDLANHAARLDSSLEEGRYLVRDLGATLRQREIEIKALAGQITSDRKLFIDTEMK